MKGEADVQEYLASTGRLLNTWTIYFSRREHVGHRRAIV